GLFSRVSELFPDPVEPLHPGWTRPGKISLSRGFTHRVFFPAGKAPPQLLYLRREATFARDGSRSGNLSSESVAGATIYLRRLLRPGHPYIDRRSIHALLLSHV